MYGLGGAYFLTSEGAMARSGHATRVIPIEDDEAEARPRSRKRRPSH